jgi:hypothetical protein
VPGSQMPGALFRRSLVKKFNVKFTRTFEVQIEAEDLNAARALSERIVSEFPEGTCKLLSVIREGVTLETEERAEKMPEPPKPRGGKPAGGGTPGTPVVKTPVLVDQIADAA